MKFCSVRALIFKDVVLSLFWIKYFITILTWGRVPNKGESLSKYWNISTWTVPPCYYFRSDILTRRTSKLPLQSQQARRSYEQSQPSPFTTPVLPHKNVPLPLPLPLPSSPLPQQEERIYAQPILSQVCSMLHVFSFIGSYCRYLNIKLVMLGGGIIKFYWGNLSCQSTSFPQFLLYQSSQFSQMLFWLQNGLGPRSLTVLELTKNHQPTPSQPPALRDTRQAELNN